MAGLRAKHDEVMHYSLSRCRGLREVPKNVYVTGTPFSVSIPRANFPCCSLLATPKFKRSEADIDFQPDDLGLDLTEISGISGFLMNEPPDSSGHFYPPWVSELDPVKPEPMIFEESNHPRPQSGQSVPPTPTLDTKVDMSLVNTTNTNTRVTPSSQRGPKVQTSGAGSTVRKTASGGVTRRRSSSKEEQAKKRRERNRVLARRTRLRKKFFFQSLQQQVRTVSPLTSFRILYTMLLER